MLEAKLATQEESVFWNLLALALQEYGYSPSKLEWDERAQTYNLRVNQLRSASLRARRYDLQGSVLGVCCKWPSP